MKTRSFTEAEIEDADLEEVSSRAWRHGRHVLYVFPLDGKHWMVEIDVHSSEGMQIFGDVEGTEVHEVEKTVKVWEPVQ